MRQSGGLSLLLGGGAGIIWRFYSKMTVMQLVRGLHNVRSSAQGCVATIGNFDGVHLGHQQILQRLAARAKQLGLPSCVIIFEPQPLEYFKPEQAPVRLTRLRDKLELFQQLGVDWVLCVAFNRKFQQLSAEEFVRLVLVKALHVKHLQVGDDFRFGCDRSGDFDFLQAAGTALGFSVEPTLTVMETEQRISSTLIRQALAEADLALAEQLLGRPFSISGRVMHGQKLGRTLQAPTANVQLKRYLAPMQGVFAVQAQLADGRCLPAVANIGTRPTVEQSGRAYLEVHLLDFVEDLYGQRMTVVFYQKLRDEEKFASLDALQVAIAEDVRQARLYWQRTEIGSRG